MILRIKQSVLTDFESSGNYQIKQGSLSVLLA